MGFKFAGSMDEGISETVSSFDDDSKDSSLKEYSLSSDEKARIKGFHHNAESFFVKEKYKKAISEFKKILKIVPGNYHCYHYIALCYGKLYKFKKAILFFDKAIKKKEDDDLLLFNKGLTLYYSNYKNKPEIYDEALKWIVKALEKNPTISMYHYYKAVIFYKQKRYRTARDVIEAAMKYGRTSFENYENIKAFDKLIDGSSSKK